MSDHPFCVPLWSASESIYPADRKLTGVRYQLEEAGKTFLCKGFVQGLIPSTCSELENLTVCVAAGANRWGKEIST